MMPSKVQIPVLPFILMPAQTWTLVGCLGLQYKTGEMQNSVLLLEPLTIKHLCTRTIIYTYTCVWCTLTLV